MAKKNILNGILLGIGIALFVLYISSQGFISQLGFIDTAVTSISDWFQAQEWMPEFLATITWFNWLVAGTIGLIIGLWVEYN